MTRETIELPCNCCVCAISRVTFAFNVLYRNPWEITCGSFKNLFPEVAQSCPTLCDPMDCSLPGSSVHGISRQEYWSGLPFPSPGDLPDRTGLSYIAGRFFTVWSTRKALPRQRREASISLASTPSLFSGWILILIFRIHISVASRFSLFPSLDLISLFCFFLALTRCLQNLVSSIRDWTRATGCESARS